jgi:hypothetical protein
VIGKLVAELFLGHLWEMLVQERLHETFLSLISY